MAGDMNICTVRVSKAVKLGSNKLQVLVTSASQGKPNLGECIK